MHISFAADLPTDAGQRPPRIYGPIITAVRSTDGWAVVRLDEIPGATRQRKQTAVSQACRIAGIPVRTRSAGDCLYIQRRNQEGAQ
jgi:hypothetical protein